MKIKKKQVGYLLQAIVGVVFIVSAALKLFSIEALDVFVYEHRFLAWGIANFSTRLLISVELFLGVMLVLNLYARPIRYLSLGMVVLFSLYLFAKPYLFPLSEENCHCFGDVFQMSRTESLLKNLLLVILLLFASRWSPFWQYRFQKWIFASLAVVCLATPIILKPTDLILSALYDKTVSVDEELLGFLYDNPRIEPLALNSGRKVLCLFSTKCSFCVKMRQRMHILFTTNQQPETQVKCLFNDADSSVQQFFQTTKTPPLPYSTIDPILFHILTEGQRPIVLLLEDGKVKRTYSYTNFDDAAVLQFLN